MEHDNVDLGSRVQALEQEVAELKEGQRRLVKRITMKERVNAAPTKRPELLSYKQAGELLGGKSAGAIRQMVVRGKLRAIRPFGGRRAYIDSREIEDLIERSARVGDLDAAP